MPIKPNPCVKCGSTHIIITQVGYPITKSTAITSRVRCARCGYTVMMEAFTEQDALAAWNAANPKEGNTDE